ncbi:hypothetical protein ALC56_03150 [Trachymyrmex septentrionalis]|uniref:Uncharacterized protein n=1 Tax=Trachymyrmex septentrionalis TaxID=34720 RepID=A0A151JZN1_9HYME|nr:hypothetical protein ALC56_03150 [Trachymyrmex septentrionalis]
MPGDVTLESTMAAAPCGSWRHLAPSFLGRPETVRRFARIAYGRCSWSQSGPAVSCLRASTGLVIDAERPNAPRSRGESQERRRDGTARERASERANDAREVSRGSQSTRGGPNSCTVSCVCASCVGRHSVVRCPRARRDSRRENNGVDLGPCSGNERERESVRRAPRSYSRRGGGRIESAADCSRRPRRRRRSHTQIISPRRRAPSNSSSSSSSSLSSSLSSR